MKRKHEQDVDALNLLDSL